MTNPRVQQQVIMETSQVQEKLPEGFVGTFKAADVSPSVMDCNTWKCGGSAVTIIDFKNGQQGQHINILGDGVTTLTHGTNIIMSDGADLLLATDTVYQFILFNGKWYQVGGSGGGGTSLPANALGFLHNDGAGVLSWAAAGGSSTPFFNPFAVDPATANAKSDGFDGGSLNAKWTPSGAAGEVISVANSLLVLTATGSVAASISQPAPVGAFKITVPISIDPLTTNFQQGGIFLQATSGKVVNLIIAWSTGRILQAQRLTNMDVFSAAIGAALNLGAFDVIDWLFIRIEYDGTNLKFSYSKNGKNFVQLSSETLAAYLIDINKIGLRVTKGGSAVTTTLNADSFIVE